jgi:Sec-independent protein secretion pathway component TatC
MIKKKIKPQTLLSTLWIFILLNMVFRDLHQLGKKSFLEEIMTGVVNEVEITDELMLIGGFLAEIPILMVLLSRILSNKVNKLANIIASIITMLVLFSGLASADMDDVFFMIIEAAAFVVIIVTAWKLPSAGKIPANA